MTGVLLAHAAATLAMAGIVWFVQVVQYPAFAALPPEAARALSEHHLRRTGIVVGPPMAVEALTAVWLLADRPPGVGVGLPLAGALLLLAIWISTALLQRPDHARVATSGDPEAGRALTRRNLPRALLWTARVVVVLAMLAGALSA